jgi:hypothetical protein
MFVEAKGIFSMVKVNRSVKHLENENTSSVHVCFRSVVRSNKSRENLWGNVVRRAFVICQPLRSQLCKAKVAQDRNEIAIQEHVLIF